MTTRKLQIFLLLFLFLATFLLPVVSHSVAEPPQLRKYNRFLMEHIIKNPTETHYSLIGEIIPVRGPLNNITPIMWLPHGASKYRVLVYAICINVNIVKIDNEKYDATLDIWTMSGNSTQEHKKLMYHLEKGYIKYGDNYGLFPFYIVGLENKSKIERVDNVPYFGFWVRHFENIDQRLKRNNSSKDVNVDVIRAVTNETFSSHIVINNTPYLFIPQNPVLELFYRWRIPIEVGGLLSAQIFPFTNDTCAYYLLSGTGNSIYFDYDFKLDGLTLVPTESYVDFFTELPPQVLKQEIQMITYLAC